MDNIIVDKAISLHLFSWMPFLACAKTDRLGEIAQVILFTEEAVQPPSRGRERFEIAF